MEEREILELATTYLPAPGIDSMMEKGFAAWSVEQGGSVTPVNLRFMHSQELLLNAVS